MACPTAVAATEADQIDNTALRLELECVLNQRQRILGQALLFEAFEILLVELRVLSDVVVADLVELWKHQRTADRAGQGDIRVERAVGALLIAARFVDLVHKALERVGIAEGAAAARGVQ